MFRTSVSVTAGVLDRENQQSLVRALNEKVDLPFLSDEQEHALLGKALDLCADALEKLLPEHVITAMRGAAGDEVPLLKKQCVARINDRVDLPMLSEEQEGLLITTLVDVVVGAVVDGTDGELLSLLPIEEQREKLGEQKRDLEREKLMLQRGTDRQVRRLQRLLEAVDIRIAALPASYSAYWYVGGVVLVAGAVGSFLAKSSSSL